MPEAQQVNRVSEAGLLRGLGRWDAFFLSVGTVIGSGVFLTPHSIAQSLPSPGWMLVVWTVAGVLSLMGALCIAELGALYPEAGGLYVYLREAYGPMVAFLYGWVLFLIIHTGSAATLAVAFNIYVSYFLPLTPGQEKLVSVGLLTVLTLANCLGIRLGAAISNFLTVLKVGAILFMSGAIFLLSSRGAGNFVDAWNLPEGFPLVTGMGAAMIGALWAYEGWHTLSFTTGEIREPQKNFPIALIASTAAIVCLYLLANSAYLHALTVSEMAEYPEVAARSSNRALGGMAGAFIASAIMISIVGACHGTILSGPRVFFAMARDGLFLKSLSWVHPGLKTPVPAIVAQGIWACILSTAGNFQELFSYVVFGGWIFYGLSVSAVIVLRKKAPSKPRPFKTPMYPWLPVLFTAMAFFLVLNSLWSSPRSSVYGLGFLALGVPAYWLRRLLGQRT